MKGEGLPSPQPVTGDRVVEKARIKNVLVGTRDAREARQADVSVGELPKDAQPKQK